jgi:molybdenum cofactor synthesis domain-containing protein
VTIQGGGGMLSLEDALERILQGCVPLPTVTLPLDAALGQVLAAPVVATTSLPPWDNSAMDGFAVRSADVAGASDGRPVRLRVTGEVAAGHEPGHAVEAGTAMRITTGAMVPPGADAVVPVEDTDAPAGVADLPASVAIRVPPELGANVRRAGDDVRSGDRVLEPGRLVGPAAIALAAASGAATFEVHRRPRVGILATGDELTPPGEPLGPGRIHDSNSTALLAQARSAGATATSFGIAPDDPAVLHARLAAAIAASDVVVLSGGVSVGAHDHVRDAFEALGEVAFWRVAIQPGKPLAFGRTTAGRGGDLADADRPVALFGLPGNPVSAFVTFELFVRPLLRVLRGHVPPAGALVPHAAAARRRVTARLAAPVTKSPGRRAFLRVRLEPDPSEPGRLLARPADGQGSHVLSALAAADGLAVVPESVPGLPAGHEVEVWVLEGEGA